MGCRYEAAGSRQCGCANAGSVGYGFYSRVQTSVRHSALAGYYGNAGGFVGALGWIIRGSSDDPPLDPGGQSAGGQAARYHDVGNATEHGSNRQHKQLFHFSDLLIDGDYRLINTRISGIVENPYSSRSS